MHRHPEVYAFDAYGTLFDVHSAVLAQRDVIGAQSERLSEIWLQKQLEYSWIRAASGRHATFRAITEQALDYALLVVGGLPRDQRAALLASYDRLAAYADVTEAIAKLRAANARLAIFSNGDPAMLDGLVQSAGLDGFFEAVLSASQAATFKPMARAYALVTERFGVAATSICFVSSNRWDVAGAKAFGFRTVWLNRAGLPDEYPDLATDRVIGNLASLQAAGV